MRFLFFSFGFFASSFILTAQVVHITAHGTPACIGADSTERMQVRQVKSKDFFPTGKHGKRGTKKVMKGVDTLRVAGVGLPSGRHRNRKVPAVFCYRCPAAPTQGVRAYTAGKETIWAEGNAKPKNDRSA